MKYLTFDFDLCRWGEGQKISFFLFSFIWLLYGTILNKIDPAVQDLLQNEKFDF